jgi:hypothetical protein
MGIAITAGNLATMRPLFRRMFGSGRSESASAPPLGGGHPPTIGALDRAKASAALERAKANSRDAYDLTTLPPTDDETGVTTIYKNDGGRKITYDKQNRITTSFGLMRSESQEELYR